MSKMKNLVLAAGIVSSFAVPALALTSYANATEETATLDINVSIDDIISMSLSAPAVGTNLLPGTADTSLYTTATVSTNSPYGYTLTLVDSDDNASLQNAAGASIAPISTQPVGTTNPGWAVQVEGQSTWNAVPTQSSGNVIIIKNYVPSPKAVTTNDTTTVYYGIATASDQLTGTYTDTVTYTATAN